MANLFLYAVQNTLFDKAKSNWKKQYSTSWDWLSTDERDFCDFIGITTQERAEYEDSWQLKVPRNTYKKLEVMASDTPHHLTLFKIIDIRN